MSKKFTELVIDGTFDLVKGFLLGFKCGTDTDFDYFFHQRSGIRRDTLAKLLKEVLALDNTVHLCLENAVLDRFRQAIDKSKHIVGLEIKKERPIKEAQFNFSFSISNREAAKRVKTILGGIPPDLALEEYEPREEEQKGKSSQTGGYAPLHAYTFKGNGTARGNFGSVMELFLKIKRMPENELVLVGDIILGF